MMRAVLLLLPLGLVSGQYDYIDSGMVDDIFGDGGGHQSPEPFPYTGQAPETECTHIELRPCVECSAFHQYWQHYGSALECHQKCNKWTFVTKPDPAIFCTLQHEPHCGIDGHTYSNKCQAQSQGVGAACRGECPCPTQASVCSFQGNLDGDTICKAYKFLVDESVVYVYRPPCLADDLEVNGGVWRGETQDVGHDTFPNGWGVLQYSEGDHLNRDKYDGNMVQGVMEGHGNLFWLDGSLYSGQFVNNSKQGEGTLFYSNGDIFAGHWNQEKKTGEGRYMFAKGGEFKGGFQAGLQEGDGKFDMVDDRESWQYFQGQYKGGRRKTGEYKLTSGDLYTGEFEPALDTYGGQGKYVWACGKVYTGGFQNGLPDGQGELIYPEGWKYTGNFVKGNFEGAGKFLWSPSSYYEGNFSNGQMTGEGSYYLQDGGVYKDGEYFPNREDLTESYEAMFDGTILKYKRKSVKSDAKGKKGGYGK